MSPEVFFENVEKKIEACAAEGFFDYLRRALPTALDARLSKLLAIFRDSDAEERKGIRERLPDRFWGALPVFAERMAILAVRRQDPEYLLDGFAALALESGWDDPRESLMVMSLLHRSAEHLGLDPEALFDGSAAAATPEFGPTLRSFARRDPAMKTLGTMGYEELKTPEGKFHGYRRKW